MPTVDPTIVAWQSELREIGMLELAPTESASERFPYWQLPDTSTFLGKLESDALCLLADGTLCVYDHEVAGRVLCVRGARPVLTDFSPFRNGCVFRALRR